MKTQIVFDNPLNFGNNLSIELPRIVGRTAAHRDLEQKLEWNQMHRQIKNVRTRRAEELLHQVEIFSQAAIRLMKTCVDARVLHCPEDLLCETRFGENFEDFAIVRIFGKLCLFFGSPLLARHSFAFVEVFDITGERKRIALLGRRFVKRRQLLECRTKRCRVFRECPELDLTRAVSG